MNIIPFRYTNDDNICPAEFEVRVVEKDGEPLFIAGDLMTILGLTNITHTIRRLDDDEHTLVQLKSGNRSYKYYAVNESGMYALILKSRKHEARKFQRWVTHEVLPTIRKTLRPFTVVRFELYPVVRPARFERAAYGFEVQF